MSKPVLVIATAVGCGACREFKAKGLDALLTKLREDNMVRIELVEFASTTANVPEGTPEVVGDVIERFPGFILFDTPSYDGNKSKSKAKYVLLDSIKMMGKPAAASAEVSKTIPQLEIIQSRAYEGSTPTYASCSTSCSRTFYPYSASKHSKYS
jgi:hypothetical protein